MLTRILSLCAVIGLSGIARADAVSEQNQLDLTQIIATMAGGAPPGMEIKQPEFPDFKEVTKDMESRPGLFTLWSYPAGAKDKDQEKLLCQIPASFLGEKFMLSISFAGGGFLTGFPLEETVVQWELHDRELVLVQPETGYVVDDSKTVSDVVRRTYPERIRASVALVTKSPAGDPVIDLGALLKSNLADIGWMSMSFGPMGMMGGGGINSALSKWTEKKSFELNVEIGVALAMGRMSPPGSYDKKMVHYSFWKLPPSDYSPRVADDRVGYFLTVNQDWSKPTDSRDIFNRYIDRWHLVKRDPSLKLCEPKQPIVYYIEKTVPVQFRRAVRDGILEWNKAYEKVGFINAVEVRQQTEDNEWKDLDPEDMRYSFFRWIVTGAGFAMGPHRANPFTGQIYDADIIFDDSMVRFFQQDASNQLPSVSMLPKMNDPALEDFLEAHPQWRRPQREWESVALGDQEQTQVLERMRERMRERGLHSCDYAQGMKHQLAVAQAVLAGQPAEVIDRLLYEVIKEVVMHEVGHTLGLRHNFKASSIYSLEEIQKRRKTDQATVGSVMDYNPTLFFGENAVDGRFITPTVGPYDCWAIEYGYRPADGTYEKKDTTKPEGDKKAPEKPDLAAAIHVESAGGDMPEIPKEVLDQLPPEIKKALSEAGGVKALMAGAAAAAGGAAGPKAPAGPVFSGPNPAEQQMLHEIASRSAEPELAYATDEDCTFLSPDPRVNRFDMGADPIDWAKTRVELINKRMSNILDWSVKDQESWYHLRRSFVSLLAEKAYVFDYVARYVGGQYYSRAHRGDANAAVPFTLVDAKTQRNALAFIEDQLFSDEFFAVSPEVLNHLASSRWWHDGSNVSFTLDFPIHDIISIFQWNMLFSELFPNTLRRMYDAEMKTADPDKITVAEYLQRVQKACWSDAADANRAKNGTWTDAAPYLSSIRRSLQREYLGLIEPLVRTQPGTLMSADLHAMIQYSLKQLSGQIDDVLKGGKVDFASAAHLTSCKSRIDRMLAPELQEYGGYFMGF